MTHTPLPWVREENCVYSLNGQGVNYFWAHIQSGGTKGQIASKEELTANAEFIVRACNAHHGLLEALEEMYEHCNMSPDDAPHRIKARAAIAKAKHD